ncbi:MAG TPA: alpha/beta hydrolase [Rariglobus sp.]
MNRLLLLFLAIFPALVMSQPAPVAEPAPLGVAHVYKKLPGRNLRVFVQAPDGWRPSDRRPAIILFHGGGWTHGVPSSLNDQAAHCVSLGLVACLVEYRLLNSYISAPEVCISDAKSAMRWVRAHASELGIDPSRIAAGGGSAGAHLAASVAMLDGFDDQTDDLAVSCRPQALVLFNPVLDISPGAYAYGRVKERYKEFSPAHNLRPGAPPSLILCGTADKVVPVASLKRFEAGMQAISSRCELRLYPDQIHGFYRKSENQGKYFALTLTEITTFLQSLGWTHVRPPSA